jgi:hypothetical protein
MITGICHLMKGQDDDLRAFGAASSRGAVLGARAPIMLTSRADNTITGLGSCAIALILAQHRGTRTL